MGQPNRNLLAISGAAIKALQAEGIGVESVQFSMPRDECVLELSLVPGTILTDGMRARVRSALLPVVGGARIILKQRLPEESDPVVSWWERK